MIDRDTVKSFSYADDDEVVIIDRSDLERWSVCPAQAAIIASKKVLDSSLIAEAGNAVHDAFSAAVTRYIDDPSEHYSALVDEAMASLRSARPDIQPEALAAGRASVWSWAKFLSNYSALNVLRYDGGKGERCSQLSHDLPIGDVVLRITSELDLLLSTPSKVVLREIDYKSGWKRHGIDSIASSFQFGMHAWLVLNNYPEVEALEVSVWQTRTNTLTYPVKFDRSRLKELDTRIRSTAGEFVRWRNMQPQDVPTWPAIDKCPSCPAAAVCPASLHAGGVARHPTDFIDWMIVLRAKLDAAEKLASAYVDEHGEIVSPNGAAYGTEKPKQNRKPTKSLYSITTGDSEE